MKKIILLIVTTSLIINYANSQITKGFWMFGGNGSIITNKSKQPIGTSSFIGIYLNPNGGYFFIDKLAGGLRGGYTFTKTNFSNNPSSKNSSWEIGPFVRYYFLKIDNRINILSEASVAFRSNITNTDRTSDIEYQLLAGPVIFLNSTIGLDLLAGYKTGQSGSINYNGFRLNIGLQIHLEKDRE